MAQLTIDQAFDLARRHHSAGRLDQAEELCRAILAQNPNDPGALHLTGFIAHQTDRNDLAVELIGRAVAISPTSAQAYNDLGTALWNRGQLDRAIVAYRQAIALKPDSSQAYFNLGITLEQSGDLAEAEWCYRRAIALEEKNALAHAKLGRLLGGNLPESDLLALQSLLADPTTGAADQIYLNFALAHVMDARQRYREAAEHLRVGHAIGKTRARSRGETYDIAGHAEFIRLMIEACPSEFFQRTAGMGVPSERPVFIIGLPRSGTTLTEQILAGHSQVFGAGELPFGHDDFLALAGESAKAADMSTRANVAFQNLPRIDRQTIERIARQHLIRLEKLNSTAARIIDKMPGNYLNLGLLAVLFPRAKFIHCRRDLRDVAVSWWMTRFDDMSRSHDLEDIVTRFEQYRRLMAHWRTVLPGRWLDCDYEQTVADLPGAARRLVEWCGLEWEPACVDFHLLKRPVRTASQTEIRWPIYDRSVGRWRNYEEMLGQFVPRLTRANWNE